MFGSKLAAVCELLVFSCVYEIGAVQPIMKLIKAVQPIDQALEFPFFLQATSFLCQALFLFFALG